MGSYSRDIITNAVKIKHPRNDETNQQTTSSHTTEVAISSEVTVLRLNVDERPCSRRQDSCAGMLTSIIRCINEGSARI